MPKNIDFMIKMVKDFLSGKTPRYIFELDFQTEILARYKKMVREDRDYAEYFYDMLQKMAWMRAMNSSDTEFKQLIRRQYNKVKVLPRKAFGNIEIGRYRPI